MKRTQRGQAGALTIIAAAVAVLASCAICEATAPNTTEVTGSVVVVEATPVFTETSTPSPTPDALPTPTTSAIWDGTFKGSVSCGPIVYEMIAVGRNVVEVFCDGSGAKAILFEDLEVWMDLHIDFGGLAYVTGQSSLDVLLEEGDFWAFRGDIWNRALICYGSWTETKMEPLQPGWGFVNSPSPNGTSMFCVGDNGKILYSATVIQP